MLLRDTTAPRLTLTGATVEATGPNGATATFTATAEDLVDGDVTVACDYASGATFPVGTTTVACTATDAAGNTGSGELLVVVTDTTAPDLTLPVVAPQEATGAAGPWSRSRRPGSTWSTRTCRSCAHRPRARCSPSVPRR